MALRYKFKKFKLKQGGHAYRPQIMVTLFHRDNEIDVPALIDSGSDVTVIPQGIAEYLELDLSKEKTDLKGHRETSDVIPSHVNIRFVGRVRREDERLFKVPVLVTLPPEKQSEDEYDEPEVVLGIDRIFDEFDIQFQKRKNKITLKRIQETG